MASHATMRRRGASITDLYDSACDVLFAAQQLRANATQPGAAPALADVMRPAEAVCDQTRERTAPALAKLSLAWDASPAPASPGNSPAARGRLASSMSRNARAPDEADAFECARV